VNNSYFICGNRLFLREVRQSDVNDKYYEWLNDPEINQYMETRLIPQSLENISSFVKSKDGVLHEPFFAICLKQDMSHIGNIKLGPINWVHRNAMISLFIGAKELWGKGFATEAISLIVKYGFQTLNLNKLEAGCYKENEGSARAFEKCGFIREGLLRSHFINKGKDIDMYILGICSRDYWCAEKI